MYTIIYIPELVPNQNTPFSSYRFYVFFPPSFSLCVFDPFEESHQQHKRARLRYHHQVKLLSISLIGLHFGTDSTRTAMTAMYSIQYGDLRLKCPQRIMYMVYRPSTGMVNDELILFFLVFERNGFEEEEGLMISKRKECIEMYVVKICRGWAESGLGWKCIEFH